MCSTLPHVLRSLCLAAFSALAVAGSIAAAQQRYQGSTTTSFGPATQLHAGGSSIEIGSHATTRCFDWDGDGDLDLLVGGGDGRVWRIENVAGPRQKAEFARGASIVAGDRSNWGDSYTGIVLHDLTNDSLPELLVAHSSNLVSIHQNVGSKREPRFAGDGIDVRVQDGCQGRFDVADWDGDGRADLITGSFEGIVQWHRNVGSEGDPKFAPGVPFRDIRMAYNAHPRILDADGDGRLDLLLGINWGTVTLYRNLSDTAEPEFASAQPMCFAANGKALNLREQNGDDTTPELADLNGDGVLDLISGGKNGKLFVLHGVGLEQRLAALQKSFQAGGDDCAGYFEGNEVARRDVFAVLYALQADLRMKLLSVPQRERLFLQLRELAKQRPQLLQRSKQDLAKTPHAPMLAAQVWVVARAALPGASGDLLRVAEAFGFTGGYHDLLVHHGVIFYDNERATPRQLALMVQLLEALPARLWDVELISVADWLGHGCKTHPVRARTAINIFGMNLGVPENSFPSDAPRPGITDVFLICLAHEIAHNMLDTVGRRDHPQLFERKFEGLAFAAGSDVVYRSPRSKGIDFQATKAKFRTAGAWDGDDATWRDAWQNYFKGKLRFDRSYARGNVQFFLDAPQEGFSTLANQYVADSELMLEFAKVRWDAGHRSTVHQFLLFADYLSDRGLNVPLYVLPRGGALTVSRATLTRDTAGRIQSLSTPLAEASFDYEDDGYGEAIVKTFSFRLKPQ